MSETERADQGGRRDDLDGAFDAGWLSLRSAADDRARSAELIEEAATWLRPRAGEGVEIVDLGAGTGATLRALSSRLPRPQHWTLLDADRALLSHAPASTDGVRVTTNVADLAAAPLPVSGAVHLVTASALFDLASETFIARLVAALADASAPLLAMLSYDGLFRATPQHASDEAVAAAFNAHQRGNKGLGGQALGPDAVDALHTALRNAGFAVESRSTPWQLTAPRETDLIKATLEGWADAAREMGTAGDVSRWLKDRLGDTRAITVGHKDLFAAPPLRA